MSEDGAEDCGDQRPSHHNVIIYELGRRFVQAVLIVNSE